VRRTGMHRRAVAGISGHGFRKPWHVFLSLEHVSRTVLVTLRFVLHRYVHRLSTANPQSFSQIIYSKSPILKYLPALSSLFFLARLYDILYTPCIIQIAVFSMKGGHYTKESVVLEQQSTVSDVYCWESYRQYFPEDSIESLESLFTTKGSRSVKEIWRRYTRVLYDSSVARMRRDKSPPREYWYCTYTHTTFFDAHAETKYTQDPTRISLC
jgi:hypothetical protein